MTWKKIPLALCWKIIIPNSFMHYLIMASSNDLSRNLFSYLFVFRYSCDLRVIALLRQRTLGNSSTKVCNQVGERHSELYMKRLLRFWQAREPFHVKAASGLFTIAAPHKELPPMTPVPKGPWFLAVSVRDVLSRLDEVKAKITCTFGSVITMDSTKKVIAS